MKYFSKCARGETLATNTIKNKHDYNNIFCFKCKKNHFANILSHDRFAFADVTTLPLSQISPRHHLAECSKNKGQDGALELSTRAFYALGFNGAQLGSYVIGILC